VAIIVLMFLSEFRDGFLKWFGKGKTIGGSLNWFLALHDDGLFGCLWREEKKSNSIPLLVKVEQKGSRPSGSAAVSPKLPLFKKVATKDDRPLGGHFALFVE
jgi:hypothetical protein